MQALQSFVQGGLLLLVPATTRLVIHSATVLSPFFVCLCCDDDVANLPKGQEFLERRSRRTDGRGWIQAQPPLYTQMSKHIVGVDKLSWWAMCLEKVPLLVSSV